MTCLKGSNCLYMHPDSPVPGHEYIRPGQKRKGRKSKPRGGQIFSALVAATALSSFATIADSAAVAEDTFGFQMEPPTQVAPSLISDQEFVGSSFAPKEYVGSSFVPLSSPTAGVPSALMRLGFPSAR